MRLRSAHVRHPLAAILAGILLLATSSAALAGRPDTVDPASITPELNPTFTWECWRTGNNTICEGERLTTYEAVEAIPCADGWIYASGAAHESLRRVGDADGRALYTIGTVHIHDLMSRSPDFGGVIGRANAAWSDYYEYVIPGDLDSRITTRRGADLVFTVPGVGMVVLDAGVKAWNIEDTILLDRGRHDFVDDIEGAAERACEALAS
jgi:hypothetical protein